jgi:hypothetical protein
MKLSACLLLSVSEWAGLTTPIGSRRDGEPTKVLVSVARRKLNSACVLVIFNRRLVCTFSARR